MKKSILLVSLLGLLFACQKEKSVSPESNTTTISIVKDTDAILTLPINSSPGSTGIMWYVASNPNEKVAKIDINQMIENVKPATIWGTHIWKVKGVAKGKTQIKLSFGRQSVPTEIYGQHTLDITVTE